MPEADNRFDTRGLEAARHFHVTANRLLVVDAGLRLDARPGNAESIVRHADLLERLEILIEVRPAVQSIAFRAAPCVVR